MVAAIPEAEYRRRLDRLYETLKAAAIAGRSCPTNAELIRDGHASIPVMLTRLVEEGLISIENYGGNRRVILISGTDYATARPPGAGAPRLTWGRGPFKR